MADDAWLGDQHTNVGRLGNPHEIYNELPRTAAAFLTLCNGRIQAEDALRQSIVNRIAPPDQLLAVAEELAQMICLNSPLAVQGAVQMYNLVKAFPESVTFIGEKLDKEIAETDDGAEGSRAFAEKRRPVWKGR
ncbi:MAG: enoyl-CoA hydratase-related protein [Galbitalea sp.]